MKGSFNELKSMREVIDKDLALIKKQIMKGGPIMPRRTYEDEAEEEDSESEEDLEEPIVAERKVRPINREPQVQTKEKIVEVVRVVSQEDMLNIIYSSLTSLHQKIDSLSK